MTGIGNDDGVLGKIPSCTPAPPFCENVSEITQLGEQSKFGQIISFLISETAPDPSHSVQLRLCLTNFKPNSEITQLGETLNCSE